MANPKRKKKIKEKRIYSLAGEEEEAEAEAEAKEPESSKKARIESVTFLPMSLAQTGKMIGKKAEKLGYSSLGEECGY